MRFRNEHFHYRDMPKLDRRVVLGVLASTFPGADAMVVREKRNSKSLILRRDDQKPHHGIELVRSYIA